MNNLELSREDFALIFATMTNVGHRMGNRKSTDEMTVALTIAAVMKEFTGVKLTPKEVDFKFQVLFKKLHNEYKIQYQNGLRVVGEEDEQGTDTIS